jgi:hypothetical protein
MAGPGPGESAISATSSRLSGASTKGQLVTAGLLDRLVLPHHAVDPVDAEPDGVLVLLDALQV